MDEEALCSVLCDQDYWGHEMCACFMLIFNRDGTGELCAVGELGQGFIFAVNTKWRSLPRSNKPDAVISDNTANNTNVSTTKSELLGSLQLEITPENSMAKYFLDYFSQEGNDQTLTETAFLPRVFTVKIEKGSFKHEYKVDWSYETRYGLRMTFDTSPYPPLEGYQYRRACGPDLREWCTLLNRTTAYYAQTLPKSSSEAEAVNGEPVLDTKA